MNARLLYTGVTMPMPAALSSSSRIANNPRPNLVPRIHTVSATVTSRNA